MATIPMKIHMGGDSELHDAALNLEVERVRTEDLRAGDWAACPFCAPPIGHHWVRVIEDRQVDLSASVKFSCDHWWRPNDEQHQPAHRAETVRVVGKAATSRTLWRLNVPTRIAASTLFTVCFDGHRTRFTACTADTRRMVIETARAAWSRQHGKLPEEAELDIRMMVKPRPIAMEHMTAEQVASADRAAVREATEGIAAAAQDCARPDAPSFPKRYLCDCLDAQLKPELVQNGSTLGFSDLSAGEKLRFVLAFFFALAISPAEDIPTAAHPGLLLIDSPGKEEMVEKDFKAVVDLLRFIDQLHASQVQAIVATTYRDIRDAASPEKLRFIDNDEDFLFP